jgi:hypothetical protein
MNFKFYLKNNWMPEGPPKAAQDWCERGPSLRTGPWEGLPIGSLGLSLEGSIAPNRTREGLPDRALGWPRRTYPSRARATSRVAAPPPLGARGLPALDPVDSVVEGPASAASISPTRRRCFFSNLLHPGRVRWKGTRGYEVRKQKGISVISRVIQ